MSEVDPLAAQPAIPFEDIDATAELNRRPARSPDHVSESRALVALARQMAEDPGSILQGLADAALELCRADGAGISLLEPEVADPIFRWHAVAGAFAPYLGGTTPRDFSPCGVVIERNAPQLMSEPVRYYPYISELSPRVAELLLIPFRRGETPIGTIWVVASSPDRRFDAEDARVLTSLSEFAAAAVQTLRRIESAERAEALVRDGQARRRIDAALLAGQMGTFDWEVLDDRLYGDENFARIFGVQLDASGAAPLHDYVAHIHPDDRERVMGLVNRSIETGEDYESEYRIVNPGLERWVLVRGRMVMNAQGKTERFSGVLLDITARKQAEELLVQQAEALREADVRKDEFLAMLAHELRNPLGTISSAIQLALTGQNPDLLGQLGEMIQRQVRHLTRLIDDLLDVTRIGQGKIELRKETVELSTIVDRAVELVRPLVEAKRHEISASLPAQPVRFVADPTRAEQILGNLLTNAAKYTEPGGKIDVIAEIEGDEVVLRVGDTGVGIASEMLPKVFGLFTQVDSTLDRSQGGLGIGLTLVRTLVEMHGGSVYAASEGVGKGSEFTVRLPIGQPMNRETTQPTAPGGPKVRTGRVLIVDDNLDTARLTARLLKQSGFEVATAHDGHAAVEIARRFQPAILLLDIGLPGMNGYQVASTLRGEECCCDAVFIALSGYGEEKAREKSKEAGFNYHLIKPVDFSELMSLIEA